MPAHGRRRGVRRTPTACQESGAESKSLAQYPNFTEIGQVTPSTMAVVKRIGSVKVEYNQLMKEMSKPVTPITMISVTIKETS